MVLVQGRSVEYASKIRSMSREYFIEAVQALPARDRETVEHDLKQLKSVLAKLEPESAQNSDDKNCTLN